MTGRTAIHPPPTPATNFSPSDDGSGNRQRGGIIWYGGGALLYSAETDVFESTALQKNGHVLDLQKGHPGQALRMILIPYRSKLPKSCEQLHQRSRKF